ncbi:MAG: M3 family metallopeptidase, partial [Nocardioides sp.]|nr:M3 family metallopeptidase [Nocardioides sp.]
MTGSEILAPLSLPGDRAEWPSWLADRCTRALAEAAGLRTEVAGSAPDEALSLWNRLHTELGNAFAVAELVAQVHPDAAVREQAEQIEVDATRFRTELMLDAAVFAALTAVPNDTLDDAGRRALEHSLRDFRRAGVDLDAETRARLREINEREVELGQAFSRGIRDGKGVTTLPAAAAAGLPQDWIDEHPVDAKGEFTLTTEYPDTVPFLKFASDDAARREVLRTQYAVAWPGNDTVLQELLDLRHEHAQLLGYADWAEYDAEVKMIGGGAAIGEFIDGIAADALAAGERELAILLERARQDDPATSAIDSSNWRHYAEVVRREQFDVDAQEVR